MKNLLPGIILLASLWSCQPAPESSQGKDFTDNIEVEVATDTSFVYAFFDQIKQPITPRFVGLPAGQVLPAGWIAALMQEDLQKGFVGKLDVLAPDAMTGDDLFNTNRRQDTSHIPDVGDQVLTGAAWEISMQWWTSETLGNWWDGYVRHAFLTKNEAAMERSREIAEYLMSTPDPDGYFGIYGPALRYQHQGSNGELWAKTTVFRMLLGYYEMSGDQRALEVVENGMANTMQYYNKDAQSPFNVKVEYGGVTHGLMLTDVCEMLYRITGKETYRDYSVFLYEDFSEFPIHRAFNDACYGFLLERDSLFKSHSAHTYEHLRSVIQAYYATGYPELEVAYKNALHKLSNCVLPSGAGFGNEWLNGEMADPDRTGAEVCGMNELKDFYLSALQKTGDPSFGDAAEKITFNGLLGARNADGTGITYCKTDNCHMLNRKSPQSDFEETDPRYKYSPTHADAAVCCNPSYARYFPYFVGAMWMKADDGFAATLYGPAILQSEYDGVQVFIETTTDYPHSDQITWKVQTSEPKVFSLYFRQPAWASSMQLEVPGAKIKENAGFLQVQKTWQTGDEIQLTFTSEITAKEFHNGETYFQKGPIVYALEIPHTIETVKEYSIAGFYDYHCLPIQEGHQHISLSTKSATLAQTGNEQLILTVAGKDAKKQTTQNLELIPMSQTVLRRVTFPVD